MHIYNLRPHVENVKKRPLVAKLKKYFRFTPKQTFTFLFRLVAFGVFFVALLFLYYMKDLPDPNKLMARNVVESTKIFARDGSLLYEIHGEVKRTQVNLDQVATYSKQATIAIEDKDFYKHQGISIRGIARAVIVDVATGEKSQGGSTITQQFVKKAFLSDDKSFDRKIREVILAMAIDARFSKDEILKLYMNEIPYGRNAYGIEAASESYFGKDAKDLTLAESAYLAALPQSPSRYNPLGPNRDLLDSRKNTVLQAMKDQGYISEEQRVAASEEEVAFTQTKSSISAPHFVFYVQDYLEKKYGEKTLQEGGLKVYTTLDPRLQKIAEEAVKAGAEKNAKQYHAYNAALVAVDPKTGQILAMVGGKDYFGKSEPEGCTPGKDCMFEPNVNLATTPKQPGSSFKPYAYVTAFKREYKYTPATPLFDVVTNFGTFGGKSYIPQNYDGKQRGPVSMRRALAGSLNIPAVKTLALVGVDNVTQTARDLGITSPMADCGLSLVLGGCDVKLVDHVAAYSALANGGVKNEKTPILKVEDKAGKILEEYKENPQEVLDPQAVYELVSIMTDNEARSYIFGSKSPLILPDRIVAAKTGTTNNWHDGWTMGFTPSLAAGVWAGNNPGPGNQKSYMSKGADGVFVAAPIWNQFMKEALKGTPAEEFAAPQGIKKMRVDAVSGKLPTEYTPTTVEEVFADYSVPTQYDDVHVNVPVDLLTGEPADSLTPPDRVAYKVYTVLHSEKRDDPNWENPVVAWALAAGYSYPANFSTASGQPQSPGQGPDLTILSPQDGAVVSQIPFTVNVSAQSTNPVVRVDLSIDGQYFKSVTSQPFSILVDKQLPDGKHTLAVRAVDSNGSYSDTSIEITLGLNTPLMLSTPNDNDRVSFPLTLVAESSNPYDQVSFYYQPEKGNAKLMGPASNVSHPNNYRYQLDWQGPLEAGTYRVYAQTNNGITTNKVKIIVP